METLEVSYSLAQEKDYQQVALESVLLVDGGHTVLLQGFRVVPDLRGKGVGKALQSHVMAQVRLHYPEVSVLRLSRMGPVTPATLDKYRVVAKEAIFSLCCEASDLRSFVAELRSKFPASLSSHDPLTLTEAQAETLVLSHQVVSNLLPAGTIINDWEPLKPLESNLELLRRRRLTWIVDRQHEPSALSLGTPPYAVPYRHDALRININTFGRCLDSVFSVLVAQLEALLPTLQGFVIVYNYVDPSVWSGLRQLCENKSNVGFFKNYWEVVVLEEDL
ncbi:histidine N-acetyltransferase-like isoform X2 [Gouania willdenowi]|uniref:histidine N-acetyltransferase-like isoform X2 n=1 Tax=Gouania willdenowi TaxID=441366 RepID=UPI0010563E8E|nr:histidine N-acetyltransferase-like isoform X2 [Gouania willdenowi]